MRVALLQAHKSGVVGQGLAALCQEGVLPRVQSPFLHRLRKLPRPVVAQVAQRGNAERRWLALLWPDIVRNVLPVTAPILRPLRQLLRLLLACRGVLALLVVWAHDLHHKVLHHELVPNRRLASAPSAAPAGQRKASRPADLAAREHSERDPQSGIDAEGPHPQRHAARAAAGRRAAHRRATVEYAAALRGAKRPDARTGQGGAWHGAK
mmetsp:Transcript_9732/g.32295  ORF Transcript_9732/g.32295 Transcript_9732/m.32295 type:complete len:209 (+) Transcript_9732:532-1158(+)